MPRNSATLALLSLAGAAAPALAQSFTALDFGDDMREMRPIAVVGSGDDIVIPYQAIKEKGVQVFESAGLWHAGDLYEMPQPVDGNGDYRDVELLQFRQSPDRGPGDPVKGINIGLIKKPTPPIAVQWDTTGGMPGLVSNPGNSFGAGSWGTTTNIGGSVVAGALYGDLDGNGVSRHAARWLDGGLAELMPVPQGTRSSEVWETSESGDIACGAISEQGMPSDQPKMKPASSKGIVWSGGDYTVVDATVAGPDATDLALTGLTGDGSFATATISSTRSNSKGGLYAIDTGDFTLLDGGDINGDGQINILDDHDSAVYALSNDAALIGGSVTLMGGDETAMLWLGQPGSGVYEAIDLMSYLSAAGEIGHSGWHLSAVTGVSSDGSMVAGWGIDPLGRTAGWSVSIPTPGSLALLSLAGLLGARRTRRG